MPRGPAKSRTTIAPSRQKHSDHGRLRGRAGQAQRKRRLEGEPLCRKCKERGVIRIAVEWDHIKPLSQGGDDSDANGQPLCRACHVEKTKNDRLGSP